MKKNAEGNAFESDHLDGDGDIYTLMKQLVKLNSVREKKMSFRPDHGHQNFNDLTKATHPGCSAIGRLKDLAVLSGLEMGIERGPWYELSIGWNPQIVHKIKKMMI